MEEDTRPSRDSTTAPLPLNNTSTRPLSTTTLLNRVHLPSSTMYLRRRTGNSTEGRGSRVLDRGTERRRDREGSRRMDSLRSGLKGGTEDDGGGGGRRWLFYLYLKDRDPAVTTWTFTLSPRAIAGSPGCDGTRHVSAASAALNFPRPSLSRLQRTV
jgi:hypothetical protein